MTVHNGEYESKTYLHQSQLGTKPTVAAYESRYKHKTNNHKLFDYISTSVFALEANHWIESAQPRYLDSDLSLEVVEETVAVELLRKEGGFGLLVPVKSAVPGNGVQEPVATSALSASALLEGRSSAGEDHMLLVLFIFISSAIF